MHANPAMSIDHARRGMLLMLLSILLFSLMDAGLKTLSAHYPPFQVAALRGAASLPLVLAWSLATVGLAPLLRHRAGALRGILNGVDSALWNPAADPALARAATSQAHRYALVDMANAVRPLTTF